MKIYLDYVFIINFLFDFILLLGIAIVLKRNTSNLKLFLGSTIGGLSGFIILLNITSILFFILKLFLGLLIVVVAFSYKNIKYTMNNFIYLIILSILMGGTLYLFNIEVSKTVLGRSITNNKLYIILLLITGFITIILYSKHILKAKKITNSKYKTTLFINNKAMNLIGYLDTGNNLMYKNRPVLILNKDIKIDTNNKKTFYIPFSTLNSKGLMKCMKLNRIKVEKETFKNVYLALSSDKFQLKDADIILNINIWEGKNEKNNSKTKRKNKTA